jgi:hypothetical protein
VIKIRQLFLRSAASLISTRLTTCHICNSSLFVLIKYECFVRISEILCYLFAQVQTQFVCERVCGAQNIWIVVVIGAYRVIFSQAKKCVVDGPSSALHLKRGFALHPIRTREHMVRSSRRTIYMVIYALNPISVISFFSVIPESPFRRLLLSSTLLWLHVK